MSTSSTPYTEAIGRGFLGLTAAPWREYSAPGKVFLLGEYAVLAGLPAVVAAVGPRFRLVSEPDRMQSYFEPEFHPRSPAGLLLDWAERMGVSEKHLDALLYEGSVSPGFGGSTAEFALVYRALAEAEGWDQDWKTVWKLYRELTGRSGALSPSGADLAAQWNGGMVLFQANESELRCERVGSRLDSSAILVFSAAAQPGRKVATHEHLAGRLELHSEKGREALTHTLRESLEDGIDAIQGGDLLELGRSMNRFSEGLSSLGLECEATRRDLETLRRLDAVAGCKGAGAMQADAIVVVLRPEAVGISRVRKEVISAAVARGLELVSDGLPLIAGVTSDHA